MLTMQKSKSFGRSEFSITCTRSSGFGQHHIIVIDDDANMMVLQRILVLLNMKLG
jgi:hypothetical protein